MKRGDEMIFKSIDQKIADLGFKETKNDKYGIEYERNNGRYIHKVALLHKANGKHILQSYDPALVVPGRIGNTCVGLSYRELVLFAKKMKRIGLKWHSRFDRQVETPPDRQTL